MPQQAAFPWRSEDVVVLVEVNVRSTKVAGEWICEHWLFGTGGHLLTTYSGWR